MADKTPATIKPLYKAFMIFFFFPKRIQKIPNTEAIIETAPRTRGNKIIFSLLGKVKLPSTMAAIEVTA